MSPSKKLKISATTTETTKESTENDKMNKFSSDFDQIDFKSNKEHNFKIASWNVAGLRALTKKGGMEYVKHEKPDILCLQVSFIIYNPKKTPTHIQTKIN